MQSRLGPHCFTGNADSSGFNSKFIRMQASHSKYSPVRHLNRSIPDQRIVPVVSIRLAQLREDLISCCSLVPMAITLKNLTVTAFIAVFGLTEVARAGQVLPPTTAATRQSTNEIDELFALATGHYERDEWQQAADKFQKVALSSPDHPQAAAAWFFAGEALLQTGNLSQSRSAYQYFQLLNARNDLSEKVAFRIAEIAARTCDAQAVRFLEEFLQKYPQSAWREFALYYLGQTRLGRDEPQLARQVLETAHKEFPNSKLRLENLLGAGVACRSMGDNHAAQEYFLPLVSGSTGSLRFAAMVQLAGIHVMEGEFESATSLLEEMTGSDDLPAPVAAETWFLAGVCGVNAGDYSYATECFQHALDSSPDSDLAAVATWHLAMAFQKRTMPNEASLQFQALIKSWPEHRLASHAAVALVETAFEKGYWEEAVRYSDLALVYSLPPESVERISELRGRSQYELKRFADCETTFETLLTGNPAAKAEPQAAWLYFAGSSQIGLGEYAAASETLKQIRMESINNEMADTCRMALANASVGAGLYEQAASIWRAITQNTVDPGLKQQARHETVLALVRDGNLADVGGELDAWWDSETGSERCIALTRRIAQQAVSANESTLAKKCFLYLAEAPGANGESRAESLSAMGWMSLEQGESDQALKFFEKLTGDYPESPLCADCWIAMASIHEQREVWETASWMYGHAAGFSPKPATRCAAMFKQAIMLRKIGTAWSITRGGNILKELAAIEEHGIPDVQLQYELAWFEQHSGQPDSSLARFEKIAASPSDSPVWADSALRVAQRHFEAGNKDAAMTLLIQLVENTKTPPNIAARSHFLLGQLASLSDDWKTAGQEMSLASGKSGDEDFELRCQYWIAECQYRNGQFGDAAKSFSNLSLLESRFDQAMIPWIWLRLGQSQAQINDWQAVSETVGQSAGRFSTFTSNWEFDFLLGRERFAAGLFDDAITELGKVTAAPNARGSETAAQAQWMIGEAYFHQEKYKEAIEAYYKVDSLYRSPKWRPAAILQAGKCQEHLGNRNHANVLYSQLIKKFPDSQYVAQANRRLEKLNNQTKPPVARTAVRNKPNPVQASPEQTTRSHPDARKRP